MSRSKLVFMILLSITVSLSLMAIEEDALNLAAEAPAPTVNESAINVVDPTLSAFDFALFDSAPMSSDQQSGTEEMIGTSWFWGSCTNSCAPCRRNSDCPFFLGPQKCHPQCP